MRITIEFQFHKGTIRTILFDNFFVKTFGFQFHKGTIRTFGFGLIIKDNYHFNSIKVRLERDAWKAKNPAPSFQFHKGTIRTNLSRNTLQLLLAISIP